MNKIWGILEQHQMYFFIFLVMLLLFLWIYHLYWKEKRRAAALERSILGEHAFYRDFVTEKQAAFLLLEKENLTVAYVSPNFRQITGLAPDEVKADIEVFQKLVDRSERRQIQAQLRTWDMEEPLTFETKYRQPGKQEECYAKIMLEQSSEDGKILVSILNLSDEYRVRREIMEKLETAEAESRTKTEFLSRMSHEIRTPMNGIIGMLSLLKAHLDDQVQAEDYLIRASELSQFLLSLINDILDMSRIENGKMELEQVPFSLSTMAKKLDTMFRGTAEAKGIHWEIRLQDFDVDYVIGDEMRLSQVIINFISNANKFTPAGGTVSVLFRQMGKIDGKLRLMIRVRDTGKGIKEDFIDKIFRPFEQEDASTAHNYGGSGLGMAIADNIIRLMNGQILVESKEGKGSEFKVYLSLPIAGQQETAERSGFARTMEEEAQHKKELDAFSLNGVKILLAEDNDINAEIAMELLAMRGAVLTRAADGEEVLSMFRDSAPGTYDVILMDIQMPKIDGWEATAEIRKLDRPDADLPIFAMSANAFVEDRRHSLAVGMNGHINKPIDFEEVRRVIAEKLYRRQRSS